MTSAECITTTTATNVSHAQIVTALNSLGHFINLVHPRSPKSPAWSGPCLTCPSLGASPRKFSQVEFLLRMTTPVTPDIVPLGHPTSLEAYAEEQTGDKSLRIEV